MEKLELTMNMLSFCLKSGIIASGETVDSPEGINMANTGKPLKWVLRLGYAGDWAVYCSSNITLSEDLVAFYGDKVRSRENINNILNISDEVWKNYRH